MGKSVCRAGLPSRGLLDGATAPRRHRRGAAWEGAPRRRAGCAAGCVAAPLQQLGRRGAARRRARAQAVDGWTAVYDQDGRPRAMPDELVGVPANRCCALLRQHCHTHCSHKIVRRATRASHTHYRHTTSATRRPAREKHTAHTPNSNLNATACLQNVPSPDRGAGDDTAFSLTATARPRYCGRWLLRWAFPEVGTMANVELDYLLV